MMCGIYLRAILQDYQLFHRLVCKRNITKSRLETNRWQAIASETDGWNWWGCFSLPEYICWESRIRKCLFKHLKFERIQFNVLVQERCNSSALAMELRLSCINPLNWCILLWYLIGDKFVIIGDDFGAGLVLIHLVQWWIMILFNIYLWAL